MTRLSQVVLCTIVVSITGALSYSAQAKCSLKGKWHAVSIAPGTEEKMPGAATVASGCQLTITSSGKVKGTCRAQSLDDAAVDRTLTGTLKANAKCELSGVWKIDAFPDTVILTGYSNGDLAAFAGARGDPAFQVRSVILIRN